MSKPEVRCEGIVPLSERLDGVGDFSLELHGTNTSLLVS